jgi:hypothetical protein
VTSDVGFGDLVRAWDAVKRDPDAVPILSRVLGLRFDGAEVPPAPQREAPGDIPPSERPSERVEAPSAQPSDTEGSATATVTELEELTTTSTPATPTWLAVEPLPRAPKTATPLPEPPRLFLPSRERGLLSAVARTLRPDGGLDVGAIVRALARMRPPRAAASPGPFAPRRHAAHPRSERVDAPLPRRRRHAGRALAQRRR